MGNSQSEIPGSAAAVDNDAESTGLLAEAQTAMKQKILGAVGMKNEASEGSSWSSELGEEIEEMCSLTMQQRMIGFAVCASFGFLISFGSFFRFAKAMAGQPAPFAVNYSLGNIIALCSTGFLVGPCRQLQNITTGHRLLCSVGYLSSIALTLFASFNKGLGHGQAVLILALCVVQFICWAFYVMSYIPFGRTLLKQCITKVLARIIPSE